MAPDGNSHSSTYDFDDLAITPVLNEQNESVRVTVPIENTDCVCQLWQVNVGRVTLYLIDTTSMRIRPI